MNSVGIDLHRNRSQIAVIDRNGELSLSRRIVNDRATFLELLAGLEGESRIAVEATYGWEWLARPTRRQHPYATHTCDHSSEWREQPPLFRRIHEKQLRHFEEGT
jgi:hypothetical protein